MKTKAWIVASLTVLCGMAVLVARAQSTAKGAPPAWKPFTPPPSVTIQEEVKSPPAGWTVARDDAPHILAGITFFDGPPAEMGALKYNTEKKVGSKLVLTWILDPETPRGSWIRCHYAGTNAVLDQQLPRGASAARVTLDTESHVDGYEQIVSIELK